MHKRKIMNYHQNVVDRVIAAQILADRAGLDNFQKEKLVEKTKKSEKKESKKNNFIRLANKRVNNSINSLKLVANLANKKNYLFTNKEVDNIINILNSEIKKMKSKFKINKRN
tara:strand:+ start:77 stop:415 length:339 start_codon:yes stop_codon:yes gene_type:complete